MQWVRQLIKAGEPGDALDHVVVNFPGKSTATCSTCRTLSTYSLLMILSIEWPSMLGGDEVFEGS